ncbi:hypothetical protein [Clostridium sp. M14]|uniref:hypothetical protein n=1 Tax=Clostridium sp. M14 TaxID=2716311 RepID=UPI0013EE8148|nr:hypothetical protein [Clostridium sp. M14]MBZ9693277.1 hypothetical protein [Clostridium sp. M14]
MFKNINTGYIVNKLIKLSQIADKENFKEFLSRDFPNVVESHQVYESTYFHYKVKIVRYEIKIDKITYGFEESNGCSNFVYIKVGDIVIYHNRNDSSCDGLFENTKSGWNHNSPNNLLKQIKNDSNLLNQVIKNIKNKSNRTEKWAKEQEELNGLFIK